MCVICFMFVFLLLCCVCVRIICSVIIVRRLIFPHRIVRRVCPLSLSRRRRRFMCVCVCCYYAYLCY